MLVWYLILVIGRINGSDYIPPAVMIPEANELACVGAKLKVLADDKDHIFVDSFCVPGSSK